MYTRTVHIYIICSYMRIHTFMSVNESSCVRGTSKYTYTRTHNINTVSVGTHITYYYHFYHGIFTFDDKTSFFFRFLRINFSSFFLG